MMKKKIAENKFKKKIDANMANQIFVFIFITYFQGILPLLLVLHG